MEQKNLWVSDARIAAISVRQISATLAGHDGKQERHGADKHNRGCVAEKVRGQVLLLSKWQSLCWDLDHFERFETLPENPVLGRIQGVLFIDDDASCRVQRGIPFSSHSLFNCTNQLFWSLRAFFKTSLFS